MVLRELAIEVLSKLRAVLGAELKHATLKLRARLNALVLNKPCDRQEDATFLTVDHEKRNHLASEVLLLCASVEAFWAVSQQPWASADFSVAAEWLPLSWSSEADL